MNPLGELMQSHGHGGKFTATKKRHTETRQDRINNSRYSQFTGGDGKIIWSKVYDKWDQEWITPDEKLIKKLKRIW